MIALLFDRSSVANGKMFHQPLAAVALGESCCDVSLNDTLNFSLLFLFNIGMHYRPLLLLLGSAESLLLCQQKVQN